VVSLSKPFFLTSIFGFFVLACPASGHVFNRNNSYILNYSTPDSVLDLRKVFPQSYLTSYSFSVDGNDWKKFSKIPILGYQSSPEFDQRFSFYQGNHYEKERFTSHPIVQRKLDYRKASLIGGLNVVAIAVGLPQAINTWGKSEGKFHIKDDWNGDGLAQTDEMSHFMWGYKMTQFLYWAYEWVGFSPKTSRTLSLCESSLILTLVEYPIDAYNPKQGLGVSDLIFDYLGVGMVLAKERYSWLNDFDFKLSWKKNVLSENQTLFAQTYEEFDNFIYWLTYRTKVFFPKKFLCFGIGYSSTRSTFEPFSRQGRDQGKPKREFYGGIGLSIPDFTSFFGKRAGDFCKFLEILYPNVHIRL
jgi:hypothetical protein